MEFFLTVTRSNILFPFNQYYFPLTDRRPFPVPQVVSTAATSDNREDASSSSSAAAAASTPSNLLVTFLEYCSIVMQDTKTESSLCTVKLSFLILLCISEDQVWRIRSAKETTTVVVAIAFMSGT